MPKNGGSFLFTILSLYGTIFYAISLKGGCMEGWRILQTCELKGSYKKEQFINLINQLSQEQLDNFCREYWALLHFYDSNVISYCTVQKDVIEQHPEAFSKLAAIEGDLARSFEKII